MARLNPVTVAPASRSARVFRDMLGIGPVPWVDLHELINVAALVRLSGSQKYDTLAYYGSHDFFCEPIASSRCLTCGQSYVTRPKTPTPAE